MSRSRGKVLLPLGLATSMVPARLSTVKVRAPRGWLGVAFLGIWLYFLSQVFQVYNDAFATSTGLTPAEGVAVLAITSNLGQILFFSGVLAALWRANRAAGLSPSGIRGLVVGSTGLGVLALFEVVHLFDWLRVSLGPVSTVAEAYRLGNILGVVLGLAGIASLGVGLSQAVGLFGRAEPEARVVAPDGGKVG